jgi:predicted transposase YdaD
MKGHGYQSEFANKFHAEGRTEGRAEGRAEGRLEGERALLLRLLRARFGELPAAALRRIEAAESATLERWGERVLTAGSLAEVLEDPS